MKRIVNGVTYNTDTSTAIARWQREDEDEGTQEEMILYQTRGGAFFVHEIRETKAWNEREREYEERSRHAFEPMSPEEAHKWLLEGDVEVFHNPFDDPPEASAEAEPGATIYLRVPSSLKNRVDEAAKNEKVSGNVWAMRCVERCLAASGDDADRLTYHLMAVSDAIKLDWIEPNKKTLARGKRKNIKRLIASCSERLTELDRALAP